MDALTRRGLLVAVPLLTVGCPFDDEPDDEYEYCSERFDIISTPDLVFDEDSMPVSWQLETTFTGVGHDPGEYYGPRVVVNFSAVAVSNDAAASSATLTVSLGEPGQDPWVSENFAIAVGAPREPFAFDSSLVEIIAAACGEMETCPRDLELRIASSGEAVVVIQGLAARLQSSMQTERYEGCGIADAAVETGPESSDGADASSGSGESTG
ncbi:MAG: hypothetical protein ACE37F_13920 [Nannocystaceae bacterium]|nr:hypothetical protein [bacterium]